MGPEAAVARRGSGWQGLCLDRAQRLKEEGPLLEMGTLPNAVRDSRLGPCSPSWKHSVVTTRASRTAQGLRTRPGFPAVSVAWPESTAVPSLHGQVSPSAAAKCAGPRGHGHGEHLCKLLPLLPCNSR